MRNKRRLNLELRPFRIVNWNNLNFKIHKSDFSKYNVRHILIPVLQIIY